MTRHKVIMSMLQIVGLAVFGCGVVFGAAHLWPGAGGAATCLSTHCFCEVNHLGAIKQAINTFSSLAFVVIAAYHWIYMRDMRASRIFQGFIGSMILIGLGSAYYHATLSLVGQWLDVAGMYLFGALMICATLLLSMRLTKKQAIAFFIALNIVLTVSQVIIPDARRYLFALVLIVALGLEFVLRRGSQDMRYLWCALSLMTAAYAVWVLDQLQIVCSPTSLLQGHAIWHILGAFAAYFIVKHYYTRAIDKVA